MSEPSSGNFPDPNPLQRSDGAMPPSDLPAPSMGWYNAPLTTTPVPVKNRRIPLLVPAALIGLAVVGGLIWRSQSNNATSAATTASTSAASSPAPTSTPPAAAPLGSTAATTATTTPATTTPATTTPAATAVATTSAPTTAPPATTIPAPTTAASPATTVKAQALLEATPSEKLPGGQPWPNGYYFENIMHLKGAVPSRAVADGVIAKAATIIGRANVSDEMLIDPTAPLVKTVIVRLGNPILFEPASAVLKPETVVGFDQWAAFLNLNPDTTLVIAGHTDNQGSAEYNNALALKRAHASRDRILSNGIAPERVSVISRGFEDPIADNGTEQGRSLNRRIEIIVSGLFG
jgi:OmpA-OmpF porin, OOP family